MAHVYNKRQPKIPKGAVYVGRPTKWGNPFPITHTGRADALRQYNNWIRKPEQADLRRAMRYELRGKDLVCWCAPNDCHADTILEIANG